MFQRQFRFRKLQQPREGCKEIYRSERTAGGLKIGVGARQAGIMFQCPKFGFRTNLNQHIRQGLFFVFVMIGKRGR